MSANDLVSEDAGASPDSGKVDVHLDGIQPRALLDELEHEARSRPDVVRLDLSGLADIHPLGIATLRAATHRLERVGVTVELRGASDEVTQTIRDTPRVTPTETPPAPGVLERVGTASLSMWRSTVALADMTFEVMLGALAAMVGRASFTVRDTLDQIERIGADSLVIVSTLSFLLGVVIAFQAWVELYSFGTEQLVLEFTGIGMARGLAPFIVAVLVSARTGSAIAAELATMEMRQENDALRVMGISPVRHLVVPRMVALTVVVPALSLIATAAGIVGGFVVTLAQSSNWLGAFNRLLVNLTLDDLWLGTVKSVLFGWVIGLAGGYTGFNSGSGAISIGIAATRGVVSSVFVILVVDAIVTTVWTMAQ